MKNKLNFSVWLACLVFSMGIPSLLCAQNTNVPAHKNDLPLIYKGDTVNAKLVYTFLPWVADRPVLTTLDCSSGLNRYFLEPDRCATAYNMEVGKGVFSYTYIGKTPNDIYVVRSNLSRANSTKQALLFFSFSERRIFFDTTAYIRKAITLEKYYALGNDTNVQVWLQGNKIIIEAPGSSMDSMELSINNASGAEAIEKTDYPPTGIEKTNLWKDWKEIDSRFYLKGQPVNPKLIYEMYGGKFSLADGATTFALDVIAGSKSRQYRDTATSGKSTDFISCIPEWKGDYRCEQFDYDYIGKTSNGLHVIRACYSGGGSRSFCSILFIKIKLRKSFDCNGIVKDQLLMCLERTFGENSIDPAKIAIQNNTVTIQISTRHMIEDPPGYKKYVLKL